MHGREYLESLLIGGQFLAPTSFSYLFRR